MQQSLIFSMKRLPILAGFAIMLFFASASVSHGPVSASLTCAGQERAEDLSGRETGCGSLAAYTIESDMQAAGNGITTCVGSNEPENEEKSIPLLPETSLALPGQVEDNPADREICLTSAGFNPDPDISNKHCNIFESDSGDAGDIMIVLETEPELIQISSAAELADIMSSNRLDLGYIQTGDICLSDYLDGGSWVPIGGSGNPFTGTYDGGGFLISGLYIDRPQDTHAGLFGSLGTGAVVKNIILELIAVTGKSQVGGLAGAASHSEIINCAVRGLPEPDGGGRVGTVTASGNQAGGLVGYASDSLVEQSTADISVHGHNFVGGLIGTAEKTVIMNCCATGSAGGNDGIGGLVGSTTRAAAIENSFAAAHVSGNNALGGLVGHNGLNSGSSAESSYWDIEMAGPIGSALGSGLSAIEMSVPESFLGWDFTGTWVLGPGSAHPWLLWQLAAADPPVDDGGNGNGNGSGGEDAPVLQPPVILPGNPGFGGWGGRPLPPGPVFTGPFITMIRPGQTEPIFGQAEFLCSMGILSIVNAYLEMLEEISFNLQEGSEPFAFLAAFQARMLLKTVYFLLNNYGHQLEPSEAALLLQRAESVHNKFQVNL